ncbi:response regulator [bacterium]|nr:response regulator [bacterium]
MNTPIQILLVEDEFLIALGLEQELLQEGYDVIKIVSSGEDAIEVARQQSPDIILMDIRLAGKIDGVEAAEQIQSFSSTPIIFMTGYSNPETMNRAKKLNPLGYLIKSVSIAELKIIIDGVH